MIDATLNGVTLSAAVPEAVIKSAPRPLLGARRDEFVKVPGMAGELVYREEPGDRIITLHIVVLVDDKDELQAKVETLADWADTPDGRVKLVLDDEPDRYWLAILANGPPVNEEGEYDAATSLEFRAGAYALAVATTTEDITASGSPDSGTFNLAADVAVTPIVQITPTNGDIESFSLTTNDATIDVTPTDGIPEDTTVTVSSISLTVTTGPNTDTELTGAYDAADVDMADVAGEFPILLPGTNSWQLEWVGTATEVTISITWRRRFRR